MKEIRLHGRGGLGTVKAAEILVHAAVMSGKYGNSIPFFGFERQGAPVTAFVRIDEKPIRPKNQVHNPNCVVVLDPNIMYATDVFVGIKNDCTFILNTTRDVGEIEIPPAVGTIGLVDATSIALETLNRPITNTIMLGALIKTTGMLDINYLIDRVGQLFGAKNIEAVKKGYEMTRVYAGGGGQ